MSNPTQSDQAIPTIRTPSWEEAGYYVLQELKSGRDSRERLHSEIKDVSNVIVNLKERIVAQEAKLAMWATLGGAAGGLLAQYVMWKFKQ